MRARRAGPPGLVGLLLLAAAAAPAQVSPNRTTRYLHPTDALDARAVWVNPAGLARVLEASVHADLTVANPGGGGRLRQLTVGFNSRAFAFGYQRDVFAAGLRGHTYRFAIASRHERLSAGAAIAWYRGGTSTTGWDLGAVYDLASAVTVGGVIANIGRPVVRGVAQPVSYLPSVTLRLFEPVVAVSTHGRFTSQQTLGYAAGVRIGMREGGRRPVRLLARVETDGSLRRTGWVFGLAVGGADILAAVATAAPDAARVDAVSLYGVSTRRMGR